MPRDPSASVPRSPARGLVVFVGGVALVVAAFFPEFTYFPALGGVSGGVVQIVVGSLVGLWGLVASVRAMATPPPPRASVDAITAFKSKQDQTAAMRDLLDAKAAEAPRPGPPRPQPAPGVAVASEAPTSERDLLDAAIRAKQVELRKLKVKLGTGALSERGYTEMKDKLTREMAELEAKRAMMELSG